MSLRTRRRERRQYKADPLGLNDGPLLQAVPDPEPVEDTSPTLADLYQTIAPVDPVPPIAPLPVRPRRPQTLYPVGRTCWCGAPATGDRCVAHRDCEPPEIVHACPPDGSGETPCCDRTPFELPATDRLSVDPEFVTCPPKASWLSLVSEEPLTQPQLRKLITAIFTCDRCGARTDRNGLCVDYGQAHASFDQLAALASWGPGDRAGCTPIRRPERSRGNR